jgi:hypothetical protein
LKSSVHTNSFYWIKIEGGGIEFRLGFIRFFNSSFFEIITVCGFFAFEVIGDLFTIVVCWLSNYRTDDIILVEQLKFRELLNSDVVFICSFYRECVHIKVLFFSCYFGRLLRAQKPFIVYCSNCRVIVHNDICIVECKNQFSCFKSLMFPSNKCCVVYRFFTNRMYMTFE